MTLTLSPADREALHVALLDAEVMIVDLQSEADFLQLRVRLIAASIAGLLGGFVLVLAVIHELCDGRLGVRRNLNQVEPGLFGQTQRVLDSDDATCSPPGPTRRTSGTRIRSLMRVSLMSGSFHRILMRETKSLRYATRTEAP